MPIGWVEEPGKWFAPHIGSLITAGGHLLLAMLEKCITDAGGTYLFCDTDSAAIVSTEKPQKIDMPDGAEPITAISHKEVDGIVQKFEELNPYDRKLIPGSILKIHKLNWDGNKQRRQLYGYSIAAKRYALYTKTQNGIQIVEPKAHGLGYFYPPKDSPEGWKHDAPLWGLRSVGLDHSRRFRTKTNETMLVRAAGDDEIDAQYTASRAEESSERTVNATKQLHDAPASGSVRTSTRR